MSANTIEDLLVNYLNNTSQWKQTLVAKVSGIYFYITLVVGTSLTMIHTLVAKKVAGIYLTLPCRQSSFDNDTYVSSQKGCWYLF